MILHVSKNSELSLRKKESLFSVDLWKGVAVAVALHLALFLTFRIVSSSYVNELPMLEPVAVEIDLGVPLTASAQPFVSKSITPPIELISPPAMLHLPEPCFIVESVRRRQFLSPDFSDLEKFDDEFLREFKEERAK